MLAALGWLVALLFAQGESSAYPFDRLAFQVLAVGGAGLGTGLLAASIVGRSQAFWARAWPALGLTACAVLLSCTSIMRVDWYAGRSSCCFLDDVALDLIPVLDVAGIVLGALSVVALKASAPHFSPRSKGRLALTGVLLVVGHLARLVAVVTIPTSESASATLRAECVDSPTGTLVRLGCSDGPSGP